MSDEDAPGNDAQNNNQGASTILSRNYLYLPRA